MNRSTRPLILAGVVGIIWYLLRVPEAAQAEPVDETDPNEGGGGNGGGSGGGSWFDDPMYGVLLPPDEEDELPSITPDDAFRIYAGQFLLDDWKYMVENGFSIVFSYVSDYESTTDSFPVMRPNNGCTSWYRTLWNGSAYDITLVSVVPDDRHLGCLGDAPTHISEVSVHTLEPPYGAIPNPPREEEEDPIIEEPLPTEKTISIAPSFGFDEELVSEKVSVFKGDAILVVLSSNPSTGYHWDVSVSGDNILQETDHGVDEYNWSDEDVVEDDNDGGWSSDPMYHSTSTPPIGAPGVRSWDFLAVADGNCELHFDYLRSGIGSPIHTLFLEVVVTPNVVG